MKDTTRLAVEVDRSFLADFDIAAKLNHQVRAVYIRTLMVEAIKKASRLHPDAYRRGEA